MKRYLLLAGHCYYPDYGTGDWRGSFTTKEDAEKAVEKIQDNLETFSKGPRKGQVKPNQKVTHSYKINERIYDWYEIVDLIEWLY